MKHNKEETSYLKEMLTHPVSMYGFLGSCALAAVLAGPLGAAALIPLVGFVAAEGVAALFIPSSATFKNIVDKKKRAEQREKTREYLTNQIRNKGVGVAGTSKRWDTYGQMTNKLDSLRETAKNRATSLTEFDIEKLDDATVDFLSLWLASIVLKERKENQESANLDKRIKELDKQIETAGILDKRKLEKSRDDLLKVKERHGSIDGRIAGVEAQMITMADSFEEVYHRVMTDPRSGSVTAFMNEAVEKMKLEESIDFEIGSL